MTTHDRRCCAYCCDAGCGGGCWERLVAPWGDAVAAGAVEQLSEHVHVCVCPSAEMRYSCKSRCTVMVGDLGMVS